MNCQTYSMDSERRAKIIYRRRCREHIVKWVGEEFDTLFTDRPLKRKRPGVAYSRRAQTPEDFTSTAWMQLIRNPVGFSTNPGSSTLRFTRQQNPWI